MKRKHLAFLACIVFVAIALAGCSSPHATSPRPVKLKGPTVHGITSLPLNATLSANTTGIIPPAVPSESLAPSPNFTDDSKCAFSVVDNSTGCNTDVVSAINNARSVLESMPALSLNLSAYEAMTVPEQLFVVANLERTARGLPAISGITTQLDTTAQAGANGNTDPILSASTLTGGANISGWVSLWAGGTSNALGSDYYWMYDDGPNSPNGYCTVSGESGCWGHRNGILSTLSSCEQYMGTGYTSTSSFAEIFVGACGPVPTDVIFTWAQAEALLTPTTTTTTTSTTSTTTSTSTTTTTKPVTTTTTTKPVTTTTTTTVPLHVPTAPEDVTASIVKRQVTLRWQAPMSNGGSAITGYAIWRGRSSGTETLFATTESTSYVNVIGKATTKFYYKVSAVNAVGNGPFSAEVIA